MVSFATFGIYTLALGQPLDARLVFTALALFNLLKMPLYLLPMIVSRCSEGYFAYKNIERYLSNFELPVVVRNPDKKPGIKVRDVKAFIVFYIFID